MEDLAEWVGHGCTVVAGMAGEVVAGHTAGADPVVGMLEGRSWGDNFGVAKVPRLEGHGASVLGVAEEVDVAGVADEFGADEVDCGVEGHVAEDRDRVADCVADRSAIEDPDHRMEGLAVELVGQELEDLCREQDFVDHWDHCSQV